MGGTCKAPKTSTPPIPANVGAPHIGVVPVAENLPPPDRLSRLGQLIRDIDELQIAPEQIEGFVIQLHGIYEEFTTDELWNLFFLKLEKGSLRNHTVQGRPLSELLTTSEGRTQAWTSLSQEVFNEERLQALMNPAAQPVIQQPDVIQILPEALEPPPSLVQPLDPAREAIRAFTNPEIELYRKAIHEYVPADQVEHVIDEIEQNIADDPSNRGINLQARMEFYYRQKVQAIEQKEEITKSERDWNSDESRNVMKANIANVFSGEALDAGLVVIDRLLPSNVIGYKTSSVYEVGKTTNTESLVKMKFTIRLSQPQSTKLSENGIAYLAGTGITNWPARFALSGVTIESEEEIHGEIDLVRKKIRFTSGLKGKIAKMERTVREVSPDGRSLLVTLAEGSKEMVQKWTKKDFQEVFGDLNWPIKGQLPPERREAITKVAAVLDLDNKEEDDDDGSFYAPPRSNES